MNTSTEVDKIFPALVAAQQMIGGAVKSSANPHFRSTYAGLPEVIGAVKSAALESGIAIVQSPGGIVDGKVQLTTRLCHTSGQWIESTAESPIGKASPQAYGSCVTYLRRYALAALFNVPQVDDDAEGAMLRSSPEAAQATQAQTHPITKGQTETLLQALSGRSTDAAGKFCQFFEINAVGDLPAGRYDEAARMLKL